MASTTPRLRLACSAWWRPRSVSGGSAWPCQRPSAFHSDCPWRMSSTRVMASEPTRTGRGSPAAVGWPEGLVATLAARCWRTPRRWRRGRAATVRRGPRGGGHRARRGAGRHRRRTCSTRRAPATAPTSPPSSSTAPIWCNGEPCELDEAVGDARRGRGAPAGLGRRRLMATRQAAARRRPASRQVDASRGAAVGPERTAPRRRGASGFRRRYAVVYDIDGPRVRLGMLWFVVAAVALAVGPLPDRAGLRRRRGHRGGAGRPRVAAAPAAPERVVAAGDGGRRWRSGACLGAGGAGLGVLGGHGRRAASWPPATRSRRTRSVTDAGWTIQCALSRGPGRHVDGAARPARPGVGHRAAAARLGLRDRRLPRGLGRPEPLRGAGGRHRRHRRGHLHRVDVAASRRSSFGQAWLFGGIVAVLAPARPALRQRAAPRRRRAGVRASAASTPSSSPPPSGASASESSCRPRPRDGRRQRRLRTTGSWRRSPSRRGGRGRRRCSRAAGSGSRRSRRAPTRRW